MPTDVQPGASVIRSTDSLRVCFVSHSADLYGAERSLLDAVDVLREHVECSVIVPRNGELVDELRRRGIDCAVVPYTWWAGRDAPLWKRSVKALANVACALRVAVLLRRRQVDAVYTNTATVCVGALAARLVGRPHIWQLREFMRRDGGYFEFDMGHAFSLRVIDRLADRCVVASDSLAAVYRPALPRAGVAVVPQFVSVADTAASALPADDDRFRFVMVASLYAGKGQRDAILAVSRLHRLGTPAELLIVGDGDSAYAGELHDLCVKEGVEQFVRFTGRVGAVTPYLLASGAALVCGQAEGFGRSTIEAMRAGLPVIGARSGATVELIQDGITGMLYTTGDVDDLAAKMRLLAADSTMARSMGAAAELAVRQLYSREVYSTALRHLLESVVGRSPGARRQPLRSVAS